MYPGADTGSSLGQNFVWYSYSGRVSGYIACVCGCGLRLVLIFGQGSNFAVSSKTPHAR